MKNIKNCNNGYTLIELIAVTGVLVVISSLIAAILFSTLRGSSRTRISGAVTQNGTYATSVISDLINNSTQLISFGGNPDCVPVTLGGVPPVTAQELQLMGNDQGIIILRCENDGTISSGSASLIDASQVIIEEGTCNFRCYQTDEYSVPRIEVNFKLRASQTGFLESQSSAEFKTSVSLRNYSHR